MQYAIISTLPEVCRCGNQFLAGRFIIGHGFFRAGRERPALRQAHPAEECKSWGSASNTASTVSRISR